MDEMNDAQLRELLAQLLAEKEKSKGMTGFDQTLYDRAMSDPQAMEAGADMAGLMDDRTAMGLMGMGQQNDVPNGGQLGWTQAAANGIQSGLGMYNLLNAQKVKSNALRTMGGQGKPASMITDPHEMDAFYGQ